MTAVSAGRSLFAQYAYPPNELGYCGPTETGGTAGLAEHAKEFDGAWPYLTAIADAVGNPDPLDEDVVRSYWVGGPSLGKLDPGDLLTRLRAAFRGQVTGLLDEVATSADVLAHHSFHVFVVYPWIRFLNRGTDPSALRASGSSASSALRASGSSASSALRASGSSATALRVMQDCRIRWGTVESVGDEHVTITSRPLRFDANRLTLGESRTEQVRWKKEGLTLASMPVPGATVSAHWDWICGTLTEDQASALATATQATLDLVNNARDEYVSVTAGKEQTGNTGTGDRR